MIWMQKRTTTTSRKSTRPATARSKRPTQSWSSQDPSMSLRTWRGELGIFSTRQFQRNGKKHCCHVTFCMQCDKVSLTKIHHKLNISEEVASALESERSRTTTSSMMTSQTRMSMTTRRRGRARDAALLWRRREREDGKRIDLFQPNFTFCLIISLLIWSNWYQTF